jgi:hypothetical protein
LLMLNHQDPVDNLSLRVARGWALVSRYSVAKVDAVNWWTPRFDDTYGRERALLTALRLLHAGQYSEGLRVVAHLSKLPFQQVMIYKDQPLIVANQAEQDLPLRRAHQLRRLSSTYYELAQSLIGTRRTCCPDRWRTRSTTSTRQAARPVGLKHQCISPWPWNT